MTGPLEEYEREELIAEARQHVADLYDEWVANQDREPDTDIDAVDDLYARGGYDA